MLNCWLKWDVMTDIRKALEHATALLTKTSPSARLDAELLLAKILNVSRAYFYAHPEDMLNTLQLEHYQNLLTKRANGTPIAWLTGTREFWSLELQISEDTLIPRPETELLVELTLSLLGNTASANVLDLGTGTGAIALALATEHPDWQLLACDKNQGAVNTAQANARRLEIHNMNVLCSNWFESIPTQQFDAIVSNPPYIAENDPHLSVGDVRFEPKSALVSGNNGLDALNHIIKHSAEWLLPNGLLLLEHGFDQGVAVTNMLKKYGYQHVRCWQDWQGHDRISGGQCKI